MRTLLLIAIVALAGVFSAGCQGKTPEEIEAAKYPKAKPLTPEEMEKVKKLTTLPGGPTPQQTQ